MLKYKKTIIFIAILALAMGGYFYIQSKKPKVEYTTAPVEKGTLSQTVSATGDLKDDAEIVLNFEIGGRITKVLVEKGDKVAAGDIVAMLDDVNLSGQLKQAKSVLDRSIADAATNDDVVREAEVAVENAEDALDKTEDLNDQNVKAAEVAVENAEDYLDDAETLYNNSSTDTNKLTLTTAENSLNSAKQSLKTAKEQADLSEVNAENVLNAAKARLETAKSEFSRRSRDASVENARAGYEIALNNLSKTILRAPASGTIVEVNNKIGEILGTGVIKESFARLVTNDFIIESNIPESDIVKVKLAQKATVTFDALPSGEEFEAEVIEINPAETVIQDVVYYGIKLKLSNIDQRLKTGMSANIDVRTNEKQDALSIPARAIKTEGGEKFVDVLKEDGLTTERVKITTGLEGDEGMIEVKSGLKEGQKVVTFVKDV